MGILSSANIDLTDEVKEMVEIYSHLITSQRKIEALRAQDKKQQASDEMVRFHRLEAKVNGMWTKISQKNQIICVKRLVEAKMMSQDLADCLTMFDGTINMAPPPEPCVRIK